jgi:hypothetical protein
MTLDAPYPAWKLCCLMQVLTWHVSPSSFLPLSHIYACMACATGPGVNRTLKIDLDSEKIRSILIEELPPINGFPTVPRTQREAPWFGKSHCAE